MAIGSRLSSINNFIAIATVGRNIFGYPNDLTTSILPDWCHSVSPAPFFNRYFDNEFICIAIEQTNIRLIKPLVPAKATQNI